MLHNEYLRSEPHGICWRSLSHSATALHQHPSGKVSGGPCEMLSKVNAVAENTRSSFINDNLTLVVKNA
jgi:hypothetical protein